MDPLIIAQSHIIGIFVRTFFYGVYMFLIAHCLRWIFFEDKGGKLRQRINGFMLTMITIVFLTTTSNLVIWLVLTLAAIQDELLPPNQFVLATVSLDIVTALMIDAILIFRCWVVCNKSWPAIFFPVVLWLANIAFFITYAYKFTVDTIKPSTLEAFYSGNITINLYATTEAVIIYQILRVTRHAGSSGSDLTEICRILVECGLPYLFSTIFALTVVVIGTQPMLIPTSCALNSTMNGVAFNLLVIRVGLHRAERARDDSPVSASTLQFATRIDSCIVEDRTLDRLEKGSQEVV